MMRSFVLLLLAFVAPITVQGQGCPICGPPGAAWYAGNNPPGNTVVQAAQDGQQAFTCDFLYDTFELQINNFRIGESSCTWAKWTATQMCDCQGDTYSWPDEIKNDPCDVCKGPLDPAYDGQPMGATGATAYFGMTCDGAIMGGINRAFDATMCAGAQNAAAQYCGCGSSPAPPTPPPTPAPVAPTPAPVAPTPAPVSNTGFGGTCRAQGVECSDDYTSCCGECKASPGTTQRFCGAATSTFDDGTGSRTNGNGTTGGAGNGCSTGGMGGAGGCRKLRGTEDEAKKSS